MRITKLFFIGVCLLTLCSCATMPPVALLPPPALPPVEVPRQEIIHVVAPAETLWRISKIYDVEVEDIMRANRLKNKDKLTMGQRLIIPAAMPPCSVIPLYPSDKWKYIIIHHSATDEGNALSFYASHKRRGFIHGLGYHFVIDNGSAGKVEGNIEISPRWVKQQDGAHCKASGMNHKGIGVCLVGNFSNEYLSDKQVSSLVYLVNTLRKYYNIPLRNIIGHGQVPGANTECPGKRFPWDEFRTRLETINQYCDK